MTATQSQPIATDTTFIDSAGHAHAILPGHSQSLFEGDRSHLAKGSGYSARPGAYMAGVRKRVELGRGLLRTLTNTHRGPILVVGAGDGAECVWLQALEQTEVIGLDLRTLDRISTDLWDQCRAVLHEGGQAPDFPPDPGKVSLVSADIAEADLGDNRFGAIYSWQTFEHILDPAEAFQRIAAMLAPGGLAFIEYNPFYSLDGGHWAATIDIPWAHVRLAHTDLDRAIHTLHPGRPEWAAPFVRDGINRMTHADLLAFASQAGLQLEAFLPRVRTEDVMLLDADILQAIRRDDDRPTLTDLTSRMVRGVFRKP